MIFDTGHDEEKKFLRDKEFIEEVDGSLKQSNEKDKLMKSVLDAGENSEIDLAKVITESTSRGIGTFSPDMFFEQLTKNFDNAERIYGDSLIREITGFSDDYIKKNIKIPEFKRELQEKILRVNKELKKNKIINKNGEFTDNTIQLAALLMLTQEIDKLATSEIGHRSNEKGNFGLKGSIREFNHDNYKQIAIKQTIKTALRRGHKKIIKEDFRSYDLDKHKMMNIIYALDTSGSMIGDKLDIAKRAGIALSWKSIQEKNRVGTIIFSSEVKDFVEPNKSIEKIIRVLANCNASSETDFSSAIHKSIDLLKKKKGKKHLLLVTDGMPTKGKLPITATLEATSDARNNKISVSILGINLEEKGKEIAERIVEIGQGKLYVARELDDIGSIVLEDYYESIKHS